MQVPVLTAHTPESGDDFPASDENSSQATDQFAPPQQEAAIKSHDPLLACMERLATLRPENDSSHQHTPADNH